jgi:hypothetical protein
MFDDCSCSSLIRIHNSDLQLRRVEAGRNIYGSTFPKVSLSRALLIDPGPDDLVHIVQEVRPKENTSM